MKNQPTPQPDFQGQGGAMPGPQDQQMQQMQMANALRQASDAGKSSTEPVPQYSNGTSMQYPAGN